VAADARPAVSLEPVFLEDPLGLEVSMTFLRHANRCMRAGFLYAKHRKRGSQTVAMVRGAAAHAIHERGTNAMLEAQEPQLPPDVAKAIVNEVLAEMPVPLEEHDYLREYAHRWASEWRLREDERVVAVERLFALELAGWTVRCRVDFASADEVNRLYIGDYKSGRGAVPYDEIARRRPEVPDTAPAEERMAAKTFQLVVYVLAVVFGRPVETALCAICAGTGRISPLPPSGKGPVECISCHGSGRHELAGEQVVRGCQEAIAEYVYPGIESGDRTMLRRTMGLTRIEMLEYRESLETLLHRVGEAERSGDWPAVTSDAACGECPCMAECPIPSELRDFHGEINTVEQAEEALQVSYVRTQHERALRRELRKVAESWGGAPIRYGHRVAEFVPRESVEVRDKEGMYDAIAGGLDVTLARAKFERTSKGTSFVERDLTDAELAAASEPSATVAHAATDGHPSSALAGGSLAAD
jgi:hypothetical protein